MSYAPCPKCQSTKIIPHVRLVDRGHSNVTTDLSVQIYEKPDALLFKGAHTGTLTAWICGECGYVETYLQHPQELYAAYLRITGRQA